MKNNVKPITPRCGICHRLYAVKDNNGTGLCLKCRTANVLPDINIKPKHVKMRGEKSMKEFDEIQEQEESSLTESVNVQDEVIIPILEPKETNQEEVVINPQGSNKTENNAGELKIEDIIEKGRYGVSNKQMIPAMKKAIAENSMKKIQLLESTYLAVFNGSIRYLKKDERKFIQDNLK